MSTVHLPKRLDAEGRCCGRKPLVYKRPYHRLFCARCDAEFTPEGAQAPNWRWGRQSGGFVDLQPPHPSLVTKRTGA